MIRAPDPTPCNGHVNNRGFSTWSDNPYQPCSRVYQGPPLYMTQYHTSYNTCIGNDFRVYVR